MRILWLCNIMIPELAGEYGMPKLNVGGWLTGLWKELKNIDDIQLAICVPVQEKDDLRNGVFDGYHYYSFLVDYSGVTGETQIEAFERIIEEFNPDIIHIWGSEYIHSYNMIRVCERHGLLDRVVLNIQGILTYYEKVFSVGLSTEVLNKKDKGIAIVDEKINFCERAEYERKCFQLVKRVIGRTDWDRACTVTLNKKIIYYHCGEILREEFYDSRKWDCSSCKKHSIFISQASYQIKGFHMILEEIALLKKKYSDLKIYVAGADLSQRFSPYAKYIMDELDKYHISDVISFIGNIGAEKMIEHFLSANVFLSASLIENSSNSICEAMMLGVPVVSSFVGGVGSQIEHKKNGFLYPLNEPELMSYYVSRIFDSDELAAGISKEEIIRSNELNNKEDIVNKMLKIYSELVWV